MTDEEKDAIEIVKQISVKDLMDSWDVTENYNAIKTVLNLIEKQDKIINEMADYICEYDENHYTGESLWKSRKEVIEYFSKKVGG